MKSLQKSLRDPMVKSFDQGFISIDCGYITRPSYPDFKTNLTYVADVGFRNTGFIHTVDVGNLQRDLAQRYTTVRYFPNGTRNCYTLKQLTRGGKYLVRATFGYGNYDAFNSPPAFDLYLGANYWVKVCLVNTGSGTPFISGLDLSFGFNRFHFGTDEHHIRYPVDRYDRFWQRYEDIPGWEDVPDKINGTVKSPQNDTYGAPSDLLRSASTAVNASRMDLPWSSDASMDVGIGPEYIVVLYFAEVQAISDNLLRQFLVSVDNTPLAAAFSPRHMLADAFSGTVLGSDQHSISLITTIISDLPPLISAMEIFLGRTLNESSTGSSDATVFALSLSALFIWYRRRKTNPDVLPEADPYKSRRFKYKELQVITNDWRNVIGEGGFGHVYAGQLEDVVKIHLNHPLPGCNALTLH
uniref:Malectin-like domain-containing protein n=1 Tax=Oryza meridionalis TaxID=40149 RepID=A0A0E0DNU2_9ORYZ